MRRIVVFALALVLSVVPAFRSEAQTGGSARPDPETPALFKADRVRHDRDLGLVIATTQVPAVFLRVEFGDIVIISTTTDV